MLLGPYTENYGISEEVEGRKWILVPQEFAELFVDVTHNEYLTNLIEPFQDSKQYYSGEDKITRIIHEENKSTFLPWVIQ